MKPLDQVRMKAELTEWYSSYRTFWERVTKEAEEAKKHGKRPH